MIDKKWLKKYNLLKEYYKEHGNINVPQKYEKNGIKLGAWLVNQRQRYKEDSKNKLSSEQIALLNNLGMNWERRKRKNLLWEDYYKLAKEYYEEHGNIKMSPTYEVNDVKLGYWIVNQERKYKGKRKPPLTEEQKTLLENIGISPNLDWNDYYNLAKKYYEEHDNIDIPLDYEIDGVKLGKWLKNQNKRIIDTNKTSSMQKKIKLLNDLGMKWHTQTTTWNENYRLLKEYYEEHGNIDVPQKYVVNGVKLGVWVSIQRQKYSGTIKVKLTEEQISLLEELGIKWVSRINVPWIENYKLLKKYYEEHGNINIPQRYEVYGVKLGNWLNTQKQRYSGTNNSKLSEKQISLLEELGMNWGTSINYAWQEKYKLLKKYYEEHGNINISQNYEVDGIRLGTWLAKQKEKHNGTNITKLTEEQISLLEELGIKWRVKLYPSNQIITKENYPDYQRILLEHLKKYLIELKDNGYNEIPDISTQKDIEYQIVKKLFK